MRLGTRLRGVFNLEIDSNFMDGAQLVLYDNASRKKVFLVRRNDIPLWQVSGGGIELNEKPKEAALREAFEETGFNVEVIRYMGVFHLRNLLGSVIMLGYIYEGRVVSGVFVPEFSGCLGAWFPINKLPIETSAYTKRIINTFKGTLSKEPLDIYIYYNGFVSNLHIILLHPIYALRYFLKRMG